MAHIDDPREEFSKSTGIGIPLFLMLMYYAVNIAMVIIAVIAFFGFRNDYENQKKLMFATLRGESSALSEAIEQDGGNYTVSYDKLGEEYQKYFDKDKLKSMTSGGKTKQEFIISVLDSEAYSPISTKTKVLAYISAGLLLWLVLRSLRQIRALY